MDFRLLPLLTCPYHPTATLVVAQIDRMIDGTIITGRLRCSSCAAEYPIADGILDVVGEHHPTSAAQMVNDLPPAAWAYERTWRPLSLSLLTGEPFPLTRELRLITGLAGAERGGLMIDVGCSNGLYARALERARRQSNASGFVVGVDLSMAMLGEAQRRVRRDGLSITLMRASAQALPFADSTVDVLVMGGTLNEIGDIPAALAEWRRLLRPGGRGVMMSLVQATTLPGRMLQQLLATGGLQFPTLAELNRYFAAAGLRLRAQWQYGVVVFSVLQ
ncbi:class I SAM-dependent methyltransferase [Chloroflexus sp. Y-396-1]|uniref:class I SAM-dependent methyltransferase n=1 Tax=Chloroflexus sp. Y-396-1 TaxID=867845 RepID=UPI00048A47CE|nr:class I SAM-dependent methyltransferase [Chloroflexus sp. Y-396-1]